MQCTAPEMQAMFAIGELDKKKDMYDVYILYYMYKSIMYITSHHDHIQIQYTL